MADRDPAAIQAASARLEAYAGSFKAVHANYVDIRRALEELNILSVDGILLDLGVSSHRLDTPERGFSYHEDVRLDMRMDTTQGFSAYELVNESTTEELSRIICEYGEERWAKRIAEFIAANRPVETTAQLVEVIKKAVPSAARRGGPHPARRTFQALRIAVESGTQSTGRGCPQCSRCIEAGGRLCIITSFPGGQDSKEYFSQSAESLYLSAGSTGLYLQQNSCNRNPDQKTPLCRPGRSRKEI